MLQELEAVEAWLEKLKQSLGPIYAGNIRTLSRELPPVDQAVTHLSLAKAAIALWEVYLRVTGTPTHSKALQKEQARLQVYQQKVDKAAAAWWLSEHRPVAQLNVAAANRFITHAIPELSSEQRQALHQAGADAELRKRQREAPQQPAPQSAEEATDAFLVSLGAPDRQEAKKKPRCVSE